MAISIKNIIWKYGGNFCQDGDIVLINNEGIIYNHSNPEMIGKMTDNQWFIEMTQDKDSELFERTTIFAERISGENWEDIELYWFLYHWKFYGSCEKNQKYYFCHQCSCCSSDIYYELFKSQVAAETVKKYCLFFFHHGKW